MEVSIRHLKRYQEPGSNNEAPLYESGRKRGSKTLEVYVRQNRGQGWSKESNVSQFVQKSVPSIVMNRLRLYTRLRRD